MVSCGPARVCAITSVLLAVFPTGATVGGKLKLAKVPDLSSYRVTVRATASGGACEVVSSGTVKQGHRLVSQGLHSAVVQSVEQHRESEPSPVSGP